MKLFTYIIIAVVAVAIVSGFFVLGTPKTERMKRFDDMRITNLQDIQWQIIEYWQSKGRLPEKLVDLENELSGSRAPKDPETGLNYEYQVLKDKKLTFELCANFVTENLIADSTNSGKPVYPRTSEPANWNWKHGIGRTCFERIIDTDLYPILDKKGKD